MVIFTYTKYLYFLKILFCSRVETMRSFDAGMRRPNEGARRNVKFADTFGFVNTSGTTGLPKAAKISHVRMYSRVGSRDGMVIGTF